MQRPTLRQLAPQPVQQQIDDFCAKVEALAQFAPGKKLPVHNEPVRTMQVQIHGKEVTAETEIGELCKRRTLLVAQKEGDNTRSYVRLDFSPGCGLISADFHYTLIYDKLSLSRDACGIPPGHSYSTGEPEINELLQSDEYKTAMQDLVEATRHTKIKSEYEKIRGDHEALIDYMERREHVHNMRNCVDNERLDNRSLMQKLTRMKLEARQAAKAQGVEVGY